MNRGTFTFITAIQDETHRFANAYRKQQMKQKSYSSTLTEVPGVGPKTAKALLAQFKSVGAVKEATPDQLENTPGVGRQLAQTIYEYFHQKHKQTPFSACAQGRGDEGRFAVRQGECMRGQINEARGRTEVQIPLGTGRGIAFVVFFAADADKHCRSGHQWCSRQGLPSRTQMAMPSGRHVILACFVPESWRMSAVRRWKCPASRSRVTVRSSA